MERDAKYIVHSNKYGWAIRLMSYAGPVMMNFKTKAEAVETALAGARGIDWALEACPPERLMVIGHVTTDGLGQPWAGW